jgi:hypothetical protein
LVLGGENGLQTYSPKYAEILKRIKEAPGSSLVYSAFLDLEGIGIFKIAMDANGYAPIEMENSPTGIVFSKKTLDSLKKGPGGQPRYMVFSGEQKDAELRRMVLDIFNANFNELPQNLKKVLEDGGYTNNHKGEIARVFCITAAGAEGLSLKCVRAVHIMEPFWNYARINQVKTRAIRYKSHEDLPKEEQNVQTYIYISDYPKNFPENKKKEETTDMSLYKKSIFFMNLINEFMYALIEASIDCSIHYDSLNDKIKEKINCKLCSPDNNILFYPVVNQDMEFTSNCKPYTESNIKVDEIEIDGNKYYYKKKDDDIEIYKYNPKLQGYTKYNIDSNYANIYEKIMDLI